MLPTKAGLFTLLSARMGWLGQRNVVLGQNLANADTPDYRPRDLREGDFARLADGLAGTSRLPLTTTAPLHQSPSTRARFDLAGREVKEVYEVAPDGNAVVLEEQMAKLAATALDYQLATNLYRKYVGMVRTALGAQA
jgi:flagellar basal-body rod protein FlgB